MSGPFYIPTKLAAIRLRLEGMAEAFNALNHRNNLTLNANFGPGAYRVLPARLRKAV
ncbi:MAG: hypothetical protein NVSMB62_26750 [Acidobacteriaceae bacterium]